MKKHIMHTLDDMTNTESITTVYYCDAKNKRDQPVRLTYPGTNPMGLITILNVIFSASHRAHSSNPNLHSAYWLGFFQ